MWGALVAWRPCVEWGVSAQQWEEQLLVSCIGCLQPTERTALPPALLPADYNVAEGLKGS